ncbi:MAG: sugar phosphate isomerase/epimerase [Planctomycetota bacterium]|nr:MAG: sugar phosphate isomerase/epimerase [Planctomycetota bacterium]
MIHIGMHTDNWRTLSGSMADAVAAATEHSLEYIEFGVVDGQDFIQGMGYAPTVSLDSNPIKLKRYLDDNGLKVSQIDASYPIIGPPGATLAVRYVQRAIQFAAAIGCPCVDTSDSASVPTGYTEEKLMAMTKENYRQILDWADDYDIIINVEPHGPFTTNPDTMERILNFFDNPRLKMNFDTGNTYISGQDPVKFCQRFIDKISHMHIKDVSKELADAVRGGETGIAMSESAIGEGVNADNIDAIIQLLKKKKWDGVVSIECQGTKRCIAKSIEWLRQKIG